MTTELLVTILVISSLIVVALSPDKSKPQTNDKVNPDDSNISGTESHSSYVVTPSGYLYNRKRKIK